MSMIPRTIASLKSSRQPVVFQLLKPIGGIRASPLASAYAGGAGSTTEVVTAAKDRVMVAAAVIDTAAADATNERSLPAVRTASAPHVTGGRPGMVGGFVRGICRGSPICTP